jgi:PST family polysaccharide transporter
VKTAGKKLLQSKIVHNAASLYGVQICRKLIPLVTIPYLARVLGPTGWGNVAFTLSMGEFISILGEYGFILSVTREIAQKRDSKEDCALIAGGTFSAQAVLCTLGCLLAWLISKWVPLLASHPRLLFAGLFYGAAQGMAPTWLFQGLERMTLAAVIEVSSKCTALVAILLLVHGPRDEWRVLALQSLAPAVVAVSGLWLAQRVLGLRRPTFRLIWRSLRNGWSMFLLRSGLATYSTANVLVLALFAPASIVGYYASAEKLVKAIAGLLLPIRDAFYPRLSHLAAHSPQDSARLTRISAYIESGCGLLLSLMTFVFAGFFVRIIFGPSFASAVPILRILAILPVIIALADSIGFQTLLPAGKELVVTKAIVAGTVVNLALAFLLAPRYLGTGMAVSVVFAEAVVCIFLIMIVTRTTSLFHKQTAHGVQPAGFAKSFTEPAARIVE